MPCARASSGERKWTTFAVQADLALIGHQGSGQHLDQGRLAGAVVADDAQYLVGLEVEIGVVEGDDAAESLDDIARLQDRLGGVRAHDAILRTHWSMVTATMIRTPTVNSCQRLSRP